MRRRDTTTDIYVNKTTSTTPRRPDPEYYDDYLYDDEYSQNEGAAESQSPQRQEERSTRELGRDHGSTLKSIDYEEHGDGETDHQEPTESSDKYSLKTVGGRDDITEGPRGDRYMVEERESEHYKRDTAAPYASNEEIDEENNAGSLEYEESTLDMFNDKELGHYENYVGSGYGSSKETNTNHGGMPHSEGQRENVPRTEGYPSMEGDYHSGNMNENGPLGSGEILPHSLVESGEEEEEYHPKEAFFASEEHYDHENGRRRRPHHHYRRRPYYYYPGYRDPFRPHYAREVSEILRLVKEIHYRQLMRGGGHNRRKDYRSIDRISSFPSHHG